jgi:hypothetical protein
VGSDRVRGHARAGHASARHASHPRSRVYSVGRACCAG